MKRKLSKPSSNNFVLSQFNWLLGQPTLAILLVAMLAVVPLTMWLSLMILALITLRKEWLCGVQCLIAALTILLCRAAMTGTMFETWLTSVPIYLVTYVSAWLLKRFINWQLVALTLTGLALVSILMMEWSFKPYILQHYLALLQLIQSIDVNHIMANVVNQNDAQIQLTFAHYFLGIRIVSLLLSGIFPVIMARSIQSQLFNPAGFHREMNNFRASQLLVIVFILCMAVAYKGNLIAMSFFPILFVYVMLAGLSLALNLLAHKKNSMRYAMLVLPIIFLPSIVLPVFALFGSIDSILNLRTLKYFN